MYLIYFILFLGLFIYDDLRCQMLIFNLPNVAISYSKMPNDQLEGHKEANAS